MALESFELVILRRPPDPPGYDEATLDRLQEEHLAYLASLHDAGHTVSHGPLRDQPDESMRGLVFFRVGSLRVDVMTWLCPAGTMAHPGTPV